MANDDLPKRSARERLDSHCSGLRRRCRRVPRNEGVPDVAPTVSTIVAIERQLRLDKSVDQALMTPFMSDGRGRIVAAHGQFRATARLAVGRIIPTASPRETELIQVERRGARIGRTGKGAKKQPRVTSLPNRPPTGRFPVATPRNAHGSLVDPEAARCRQGTPQCLAVRLPPGGSGAFARPLGTVRTLYTFTRRLSRGGA